VAALGLKKRLDQQIRSKHGAVSKPILRRLAQEARVNYTTLARFLLYPAERSTGIPRHRTIASLALALDCSAEWLESGVNAPQRDIFPFALPVDHATPTTDDPIELLKVILEGMRDLPSSVRTLACRDAAAAVIAATTHNRRMVPPKAYLAMMQLDAMQVAVAVSAAG
jgi:hypothetical protein